MLIFMLIDFHILPRATRARNLGVSRGCVTETGEMPTILVISRGGYFCGEKWQGV